MNTVPLIFGLISLIFFLAGLWAVLTSAKQVATMEKTGVITVTNTRRFGGAVTTMTYQTKDIDYLNCYEWQSNIVDRGTSIVLMMQNGARVKLGSHRKYHIPYVKEPNLPLPEMSGRIAGFLGVRTAEDLGGKIELNQPAG
jgi:hypothetical protein